MGRTSLAPQRKQEILDALQQCIEKHGLAGSTMARIAEQAGVQRSLISHYFGTREDLLGALFDRMLEMRSREFESYVENHSDHTRLAAGLDYLFGGPFVAGGDGLAGTGETFSLAARSEAYRERLRVMYERFARRVEQELAKACTGTTAADRRAVAYAIVCLAEQNQSLSWLGFAPRHHRYARRAAQGLVEGLAKTAASQEVSG